MKESVYSYKSKHANTKNNDNKQNGIPIYICIIELQRLQRNCKIVTESDSDESGKDEISNTTDKNTKEKEFGTSNSSIKVYIPCLLILLNSSILNFTKQKSTSSPISSILDPTKHNSQSSLNKTELEEDQYLASPSPSDQFATNIKSDNKGNNTVATIKRLFLNIEYRSSYEKLMEKAVYDICEFFIYFARHISFKDQVAFYGIRLRLKPF